MGKRLFVPKALGALEPLRPRQCVRATVFFPRANENYDFVMDCPPKRSICIQGCLGIQTGRGGSREELLEEALKVYLGSLRPSEGPWFLRSTGLFSRANVGIHDIIPLT